METTFNLKVTSKVTGEVLEFDVVVTTDDDEPSIALTVSPIAHMKVEDVTP